MFTFAEIVELTASVSLAVGLLIGGEDANLATNGDSSVLKVNLSFINRSQIFTLLSPVIMTTRIPASLQALMAGLTSVRGGSSIPVTPTKVMSKKNRFNIWSLNLVSHQIRTLRSFWRFQGSCLLRLVGCLNFVVSNFDHNQVCANLPTVPRAKQRRVSTPVPYLLIKAWI